LSCKPGSGSFGLRPRARRPGSCEADATRPKAGSPSVPAFHRSGSHLQTSCARELAARPRHDHSKNFLKNRGRRSLAVPGPRSARFDFA
jgi:hypothetical protein